MRTQIECSDFVLRVNALGFIYTCQRKIPKSRSWVWRKKALLSENEEDKTKTKDMLAMPQVNNYYHSDIV